MICFFAVLGNFSVPLKLCYAARLGHSLPTGASNVDTGGVYSPFIMTSGCNLYIPTDGWAY